MVELKKVTSHNVYDTINNFVTSGELVVDDYDSMIEVILSMIKVGYCFAMDRDLLRDAMESLTYMYAPSDDMNKDRLVQQFADDEDDDDDDEEDGEEDFGNMDLMKMMQMMGGAMGGEGGMPDLGSLVGESPDQEPKTVTTDEVPSEVEETTVVKEDETVPEEPAETPATEEVPTEEVPTEEVPSETPASEESKPSDVGGVE